MKFKNSYAFVGIMIIRIKFYAHAVIFQGFIQLVLLIINSGTVNVSKKIIRLKFYTFCPGFFCITETSHITLIHSAVKIIVIIIRLYFEGLLYIIQGNKILVICIGNFSKIRVCHGILRINFKKLVQISF